MCSPASERLLLRPFTTDDFESVFAIQSRPDVARWLYWEARDEGEVRAALQKKIRGSRLADGSDSLGLAVDYRASSEVIGDSTLFLLSAEHRQGEIGFVATPTTTATVTRPRRRGCCWSWHSASSACTA